MSATTMSAKRTPHAKAGTATVFINARIVDPATNRDEPGGLLVREGRIADIGAHLRRHAAPGARGGGGTHAAAAGGVTTMVVMPETNPVIDQVALVDFIQRRARDNAIVNVHTMAAMTKGLKGEEMTEIGLLKRAGALAFSNGKLSVANTRVMRNVLLYGRDFGALIVHHTEDPYLASSGAMNSGEVAARLGLPGVPKASETIMLERGVRLVEMA